MIGLTPMIGMNDDTNEIFDLKAAQQVVAFAKQYGLGRISMWSLNRDQEAPRAPWPTSPIRPAASCKRRMSFQLSLRRCKCLK
jgi:hypothetical protein